MQNKILFIIILNFYIINVFAQLSSFDTLKILSTNEQVYLFKANEILYNIKIDNNDSLYNFFYEQNFNFKYSKEIFFEQCSWFKNSLKSTIIINPDFILTNILSFDNTYLRTYFFIYNIQNEDCKTFKNNIEISVSIIKNSEKLLWDITFYNCNYSIKTNDFWIKEIESIKNEK